MASRDVTTQCCIAGGGPAAFPRVDGTFDENDLLAISVGANDARFYQRNGGTLAPGNSPGTTNAGATTWEGGGNYDWELNSVVVGEGTMDLIKARCTEIESGGRMIDAILTNTVLPTLSAEFLKRKPQMRLF